MNNSQNSRTQRHIHCAPGQGLIRGMGQPHPFHPQMVGTVTVRPGQRFAVVPKKRQAASLTDLSVAELWLLRKADCLQHVRSARPRPSAVARSGVRPAR